MIDVDKWEEIFSTIGRHKLRTALTAFGVFWGIFMLVLLLGAGNGLGNGIESTFKDDAINSIWLWRGKTSMPYAGLKEGRQIKFDNSDYDYLQEQFKDVESITGRFYLGGDKNVTYNTTTVSYPVRGVNPGHKLLMNSIITEGRYISERDVNQNNKVAVIGKTVKENLFKDKEAIGEQINIGGIVYTVVGIFRDPGSEWDMRVIFIPISTAQTLYAGTDEIHQIMFTGGDLSAAEMEQLEKDILLALAVKKGFDPNDKQAVGSWNMAQEFQQFQSMLFAINSIVWLVGFFTIISGVIGVSNIMLIIVKERTKEIGIRKALGATPKSIVSMILQESVFLTAIAGYLGMACGIGMLFLMSGVETEFFRTPQVNFGVISVATLILVISGALAGLIPALKAAKINPVLAMKE